MFFSRYQTTCYLSCSLPLCRMKESDCNLLHSLLKLVQSFCCKQRRAFRLLSITIEYLITANNHRTSTLSLSCSWILTRTPNHHRLASKFHSKNHRFSFFQFFRQSPNKYSKFLGNRIFTNLFLNFGSHLRTSNLVIKTPDFN